MWGQVAGVDGGAGAQRSEQSTAEACAKHLKNEIEKRIKLREGKN